MVEYRCGWVPNLSGDVCSKSRVESRIHEWNHSADSKDSGGFCFRMRTVRGQTVVDALQRGSCICSITIVDRAGMCRVNVEERRHKTFDIDAAWYQFRAMLDGNASTAYDCSAMDRLVCCNSPSDEVESIIRRFLRSMEADADFSAHVINRRYSNASNLRNPSYITKARFSANKLYFEAFVDFYSNRIRRECLSKYRNEMERRVEKNSIAVEYIDCRFKRRLDRLGLWMAVIAAYISAMALFIPS